MSSQSRSSKRHWLREVYEVILGLPTNDARAVFGGIDSRKLRSSMSLFDLASPDDVFAKVLDKFFEGHRCRTTDSSRKVAEGSQG
ncbi:MAG: DUF1810 family protein [Muribaculaceae bacterium]|nr:DUF1810 family protein [Muribaculaceae bacterium]